MRLHHKEEGFTLIELMVVVLIIGILVAIAIPVFNAAKATAQRRTCQANLRTIDGATQQWVADSNAATPRVATAVTMADLAPAYLKVEPKCPAGSGVAYKVGPAGTADGSAICPVVATYPLHVYP